MSLLQQQLQSLAAPQTNVYQDRRKKPSLLYDDPALAESFSRDHFYDVGISGFTELLKLNNKFSKYSHLFSPESKNVQRFIADTSSNKALDEAIEGFLMLLSPYFLTLKPALKAMEWLLQRYAIHEMNVDAVMMCILPYYESPLFLRTVKVLNLEQSGSSGESNKWGWLVRAQQSGQLLVKSIMYDQWLHSGAFRGFCNKFIKKVIKVHDRPSDAQHAINFFATTLVGGVARLADLAKNTGKSLATEDHVMRVLHDLHVWLQAPFRELVCGAYLIVMQLAMSLQLQPQLWDQVAALLIKHSHEDLGAELCVCLVAVYHQQAVTHMGAGVLERLQDSEVLQLLATKPGNARVTSFLLAYAGGYVSSCIQEYHGAKEDLQEHLHSLSSYLSQYHLNDTQSGAIIRNILETAVEKGRSLPPEDLRFYLASMLETFERSFPGGYDKALAFFQTHAGTPSGAHYAQVLELMNAVTSRRVATSVAKDVQEAMEVETSAVPSVQSILVLLKQVNQLSERSGEAKVIGSLAHSLADACIEAVLAFKVERHPIKNAPKHEKQWLQLAETGVVAWDLLSAVTEACLPAVSPLSSSTSYTLPPPEHQSTQGASSSLLLCVKLLFLLHFKKRKAQAILKKLFKRVGDESSLLRLLAMVGSWQPHMPHCHLLTPAVKVMCLENAATLLGDSPSLLPVALHQQEIIVPSVISALSFCDDDVEIQRSVRTAAASVISVLKSAPDAVGSYAPLVHVIEKHSKGVFMDTSSEHLVSAMASACHEEASVLPLLLSAVTYPKQPPHLAAVILFSLAQLQSKSILEKLLPVIQRLVQQGSEAQSESSEGRAEDGSKALDPSLSMLLYWSLVHLNSKSVKVLDTERGWQVISTAFQCSKNIINLEGKLMSPQAVIAEQVISHELLRHMDSSRTLGRLWALMAATAADFSTSQRKVSRVQRALRAVSLHARFVLEQIQQLNLVTTATSIKESQAKRMKIEEEKSGRKARRLSDGKKLSKSEDSDEVFATTILPGNWRRLRLLLELVCEVESVTEPWLLVDVLCDCLHEGLSLGPQLAEQVVPQVLACLHYLVNLSLQNPPKNANLSSLVPLNVEAVVQCIRLSGEPFTHRQAFLVLSLAAKIHPEAVLHNLMAIFTFMGAGLLQRDDHFSFQVIETTVSTLVPILVQRGGNSSAVADVVQVFVDALPDISVHRRLLIFRLLTGALGPATHLWLVLSLTIKTFAQNGHSRLPEDITTTRTVTASNDESVLNTSLVGAHANAVSDGRRPGELSFILRVCEQFCVTELVGAVQQVLGLLVALPTNLGCNYKKNWSPSHQYVAVLKLNTLTGKQLRHFIYTTVGFLVQLFSSETFLSTLVPVSESSKAEEQQQLQQSYCQLLTVVTSYLHTVTGLITTTTQDTDAIACKFWSALQRKLVQLQEGVCAVLQSRQLLSVVSQLVQSELPAVKLRSLELLRTRLLPSAAFFSEEDSEALLQLIPALQALGCCVTEQQDVRQAAMSALQLLISFLGSKVKPEQILPLLRATAHQVTLKGNTPLVVMQSTLVVAECVGHVKSESIAVLPQLMPTLLSFLAPPSSETDLMPLSAATALYKIIENVPKYISRYLPELLVRLCRLSWLLTDKDTPRDVKICAKLAALGASLRRFIKPQVFLQHLLKAYNELSAGQGTDVCCVVGVLELLEDLVAHFDQSALRAHHADLMVLLKRALGTRLSLHAHSNVSAADIDTIEWHAVTTVTRVVLGQDEASNVKLLSDIIAWSDDADSVYSRIALYRLVQHLASTLQVLFIKARLADQIFDHAVEVLSSTYQAGQSASPEDTSDVCVLLRHVLASFTEVFKHDTVGFTTDSRFKVLVDPIVLQMKNTVGGVDAYKMRVRESLSPCLVHLCSATRNDALWADLNRQVLMLLREDLHPEVQGCVLGMLRALVEELKEAWLQPLLADTLPCVTEAMESHHSGVEEAARGLLALMEDIMGDAVREQLEV